MTLVEFRQLNKQVLQPQPPTAVFHHAADEPVDGKYHWQEQRKLYGVEYHVWPMPLEAHAEHVPVLRLEVAPGGARVVVHLLGVGVQLLAGLGGVLHAFHIIL